MTKRRTQASIAVVLLLLLVAGCSMTTVTMVVEAVTVAAETALSVLGSTSGIDPALLTLVSNYLATVGPAVTATTTELASTDSAALKDTKIIAIWAAVVAPNLPSSTPAEVKVWITAVASAIEALVKYFTPVSQRTFALRAAVADRYQLTRGDRHNLSSLGKRGEAIAVNARKLMK